MRAQCVTLLTTEPNTLVALPLQRMPAPSGSAFGMSMPVKKDSLTVTGLTKQFTRIAEAGQRKLRVGVLSRVRSPHLSCSESVQDVLALKPATLDDTSWLRPEHLHLDEECTGLGPVPDGSERLRDRLSVQSTNRVATP